MKILELGWSNYRNLAAGMIEVRDQLVLIGPNDTGKSSLMRALHLCLGMRHGQLGGAITARDFTDPTLPLVITVTLGEFTDDDRAAFPDEITTGPPETLTIELEGSLDPVDPDQRTVRRYFPDSGHRRGPTTEQLKVIGFQFVPAARSLVRELGGGSTGAVRSLLSTLDLSGDAAALEGAAEAYRAALDSSQALNHFRGDLAAALSNALPNAVAEDEVRVMTQEEILEDPLSGVTVTIRDGAHDVPLSEQSDGIRALSVLTLLTMAHKGGHILAVDEPETHLHPTAQRAIAKALQGSASQVVLATHSPFIASAMRPMDMVTLRPDRQAHQLSSDANIANANVTVRHWSTRLIEPLTARHVVLVEGVSDRVLLERVAHLRGVDMHREGIAVFELDGANLFSTAYELFGPPGFNLHLAGLVDEDAADSWSDKMGVDRADLESNGFIVCEPDLEGVYINELGVETVVQMLLSSPSILNRSLLDSCGVSDVAEIDRDMLSQYCTKGKNKVSAALAVSEGLTATTAQNLTPLVQVLDLLS